MTDHVQAVLDAPDSEPVRRAMGALVEALRGRGVEATASPAMPPPARWIAGIPGQGCLLDSLLREHGLSVPEPAESLLIRRLPDRQPPTLLIAGADERGLVYALREAADAVRFCPEGADPLAAPADATESPLLRRRSVSIHPMNADVDREWYFSEPFWEQYLARLVSARFNTFLLTFADQTNYMAPPYPWLFDVPPYPAVTVDGLSREEQSRNLAMLRRIGELATGHGLDFGVAIWQQQPVAERDQPLGPYARNYGRSSLRGLPHGAALADYNARALDRLLRECPTIRHLQLRANDESGIPESAQREYFGSVFDVLRGQPHSVRLELRYKGLKQETLAQAVAAGLDVVVSTKFWCEHLGLPFHPATQDPLYSQSRYGYGTMLRRPRRYAVAYQLWNQGSNRVFLWGDPAYAARFAESCAIGDADGFEVFAPLTNKGWGNEPGAWRILAAPNREYDCWEAERYWPFYLSFGRWGYNPDTALEVWRRELAARFGSAAADAERGLRAASQVLPLLTASGLPSPSEWSHWTEMDWGGPLEAYSVIPPSDYGQFYAIRAWRRVPGWGAGAWSPGPNGFVEDALAGDVEAKWTPIQVSRELDRLAAEALAAADAARAHLADPPNAELLSLETDIRALAWLARYHAARKRAATHFAFFEATGEAGRLPRVCADAEAAARAWESLAQVTDGVYADDLVFGRSREWVGTPDRPVNAHAGHWKDRLPNVRANAAWARDLLARHSGAAPQQTFRVYPGEEPPTPLPVIRHSPVTEARPGTELVIRTRVESAQPLRRVVLRHRPMDQTQPWVAVNMRETAPGRYEAAIPGDRIPASVDLLYYLEARIEGGGTLWPDWRDRAPYVKVSTGHDEPAGRGDTHGG